jgi:hypothetical protein
VIGFLIFVKSGTFNEVNPRIDDKRGLSKMRQRLCTVRDDPILRENCAVNSQKVSWLYPADKLLPSAKKGNIPNWLK